MSLKDRILNHYKRHHTEWIPGAELERIVMQETYYVASNASRTLRKLAQEGKLERTQKLKNGKKLAYYRYITAPIPLW